MVAIGLSAKSQSRRVTVSLEFPSPQWGEGLGEGGSVEGGFRPETSRNDEEGASLFVIPAVFGGYLSSVSPREIPAKSKQE